MPTDLSALRTHCVDIAGEEGRGEQIFASAVRKLAAEDFLAYGLYVHGPEHPVLRALAMSRHA